jgi:hypothetical protein
MSRRLVILTTALAAIAALAPSAAYADVTALQTEAYAKPSGVGSINFWWHIKYTNAGQPMAICFRDRDGSVGTWSYPSDGDMYGGPYAVPPPAITGQPDRSCQYVGSGIDTDFHYRADNVVSGHLYFFCAKEWDYYSNIGWQPSAIPAQCPGGYYSNQSYDGVTLTGIFVTSELPTSPVTIDGGAAYTRDPTLHIHIGYADALSVPAWPASFMCSILVRDCVNADGSAFTYQSSCSNYPASGDSCTYVYNGADGTVHECVRVADLAIPDSGESAPPNLAAARANYANLSDATCAQIIVDRQPPTITASANPANPNVGDRVTFSASSADAGSGPSNSYTWDFGDGSPTEHGASVTHVYTSPGAMNAKVTTSDKAGNSAEKQVPLMVSAPSSGGPGSTGPGSTGPGNTGPGSSGPGSSGGTLTPPPTSTQVGQQGPGGTQTTSISAGHAAALKLIAPNKVSLRQSHHRLLLEISVPAAGEIDLVLRHGHNRLARGHVKLGRKRAIGFVLTLPGSVSPGRLQLEITFTLRGERKGSTHTLTITFTK